MLQQVVDDSLEVPEGAGLSDPLERLPKGPTSMWGKGMRNSQEGRHGLARHFFDGRTLGVS